MALFIVIAAITLAPNLLLLPLLVWARWLRRRPVAPRFAAWAAYTLVALGTFITTFGVISTLLFTRRCVPGESEGASGRARVLAEGISEGMNNGVLDVLIALVTALWLLFGTWRWHWAVKPPVTKGDPPYR